MFDALHNSMWSPPERDWVDFLPFWGYSQVAYQLASPLENDPKFTHEVYYIKPNEWKVRVIKAGYKKFPKRKKISKHSPEHPLYWEDFIRSLNSKDPFFG